MAPLRPVKKDGPEQRAEAVLASARTTAGILQDRGDLSFDMKRELNHHIKRSFPVQITTAIVSKISEFESLGCSIWNAATNLLLEQEPTQEIAEPLLPLLRAFAYLLLDTAHHATPTRSKDSDQQLRNFRIGLKACGFCLDENELELAMKLLERCAENVSTAQADSPLVRMQSGQDDIADQESKMAALVSEYYLLRTRHAWKSDRLDLADHFFGKLSSSGASLTQTAEMTAQLCFEAGKSLHKKQVPSATSVKWLRRAQLALNSCGIEDLSIDTSELRLAIASILVDALLSVDDHDCVSQAKEVVEDLDRVHSLGNRMATQLLHLKVLVGTQPPDRAAVTVAISRLLRTAVLTERTFKSMMQAINRVRKVSPDIASDALEQLITARLAPEMSDADDVGDDIREWTDKACVTLTLLVTKDGVSPYQQAISRLRGVFTSLTDRGGRALSPKATHAMQTLIWKVMSTTTADDADQWCDLLRHPLFDSAGHVNKARIGRRAMNLAIANNNFEAARSAYFQMSVSAQNESITRYLAFKLAIRTNDYDFALESLQVVLRHTDRDTTFLYACALEAQRSQMRHIAIAALQAILDKRPPGVHLPSLLRCTARLLIGELDTPSGNTEDVVQETVRVFEAAAADLASLKQGSDEQWRTELQWWSNNAYNISLKLCGQVHPENLVRLLQACVRFIDAYPQDGGPIYNDDLNKRQAICHFLAAAALIVLGRSNDEGSDYGLQCYLQARQEVAAFKAVHSNLNTTGIDADSASRLVELQKFDLECILNLKQWDELSGAFQACLDFEHVDSWDALADIVVIIHQKLGSSGLGDEANNRMMELLDRIINETWQRQKDIVKASRWLRLSFSLDLADNDGSFAFKLLDQAAQMAKRQRSKALEAFPETELQWLATTAFNKAVDLLTAGANEACMEWIEGALELAMYGGDNGALHANLTDKKEQVTERMRQVVA